MKDRQIKGKVNERYAKTVWKGIPKFATVHLECCGSSSNLTE
jgi:hypothetical protein